MAESVELTIDGDDVAVEQGATLLDAIRAAGREIPTLCYWEHSTAEGLCRLCLVQVEGRSGLAPACVTPAEAGLAVATRSPRLDRVRRTLLEMLAATVDLSDAPDLRGWLADYGGQPDRFPAAERRQPEVIDDNPVFLRDYAKCVLCWRCVQVCGDDAQYAYAIELGGRGFDSRIVTFYEQPLPETTCVFCGQCVGSCPTGALVGKREWLLARGHSASEVMEITRVTGRGKRSRRGPHLDGG